MYFLNGSSHVFVFWCEFISITHQPLKACVTLKTNTHHLKEIDVLKKRNDSSKKSIQYRTNFYRFITMGNESKSLSKRTENS